MTYMTKFLAYSALVASLVFVFAVTGHAQDSVQTHAGTAAAGQFVSALGNLPLAH